MQHADSPWAAMRRPKIVQGRVAKTVNQRALLEQAYIKDGNKTVGEVVKEAVAGIGENIKIRRFERCGAFRPLALMLGRGLAYSVRVDVPP